MLGRLAKAAYLFTIALMIVSYALSSAHSSPPPGPKTDRSGQVEMWFC
jgi:hypothetical protein